MSNLSNDQVKISQRKSIETHMKELSGQESGLRVLRQNKATKTDFKYRISEMQDAVSLGATSSKENTEYKKKRNENIRAAKKLTEKATAYTLELSDQFKEINSRNLSDLSDNELFLRLEAIDFSPEMIYSDMILNNFTEYMGLIRTFEELEKRTESIDKDRLEKLRPVMNPFKERMRSFCEANRLNLKGEILGNKVKAFSMSEEHMTGWFDATRKYQKKVDDDYDPSNCGLTAEEIEEALVEQDISEEEEIKDPLSLVTVKDRIENLNALKKTWEQCRKLREGFENEKYTRDHAPVKKDKESIDDELKEFLDDEEIGDDFEELDLKDLEKKEEKKTEVIEQTEDKKTEILEQKQSDYERICQLKKDELEARLMYLLAKKEALYNKARLSGDPKAEELKKSLLKTREDVRRIKDRRVREEIRGGEGVVRQSRSVNAVSRSEAVSTDSDRKAYESRIVLVNICGELKGKLPKDPKATKGKTALAIQTKSLFKILDKAAVYTDNTRYRVGYTAETENLKELIKAVNAHYNEFGLGGYYSEEFIKIKNYLDGLTKGNLDTDNIPPGKLKDFHGQKPQEGGGRYKGWKRNGILTSFSHWSSKADTPLFSHEPTVNDLKQRMVSNCYMVSATASLCELNPEYIKSIMKDNGDGTVTVRLYQEKDENDETVRADKSRLEGLRWQKEEDFVSDTSPEKAEARRDQMISAFMLVQRDNSLKKGDFDLSRMNEKSEELLRALGGYDTSSYSTVDSVLKDLISRVPSFDEYVKKGTINGSAVTDLNDLATKLLSGMMEFKDQDDGDAMEDLLNKHRKEIELDHVNMEAVYVRVDKEVPRLFSSDLLSAGALWMQMIEKACAHLGRKRINGITQTGYRSLWYGEGKNVIQMLTGAGFKNETVNDELFKKICNWKQDNIIYTTGASDSAQGTDTGHAYSILGGYEKNGIRYVRMRNPYSQGSSTYDYGKDEDKLEKKESLNFMGGSDESYGQFDVKWEDFVKNFKPVSSNRMDGFGPDNK